MVANRRFFPGETIERSPVIVIPSDEISLLRQTRLTSYYYEWGEDCQQGAVALGCGSLFNHSYEPSARYVCHEDDECFEFIALRTIEPGDEITINYNNLGQSANDPMPFDVQ